MSEILSGAILRRRNLLPLLLGIGGACHSAAEVKPSVITRMTDGRWLAPDIAKIAARKTLVVAILNADMPPFFFQKEGSMAGLEIEMAQEIAKELKVDIQFDRQAKSFNEVVEVVAKGEADLGISKLSRTLARAQSIRFSNPYLKLNHALVINRDQFARLAKDRPINSVIRNFNGKLGVIEKSSFEDFAVRNFPKADIKRFKDWNALVTAVKKGEVTAAYRDEFEAKRLLRSDKTASLTLRTVTLSDLEDTLGIAVGYQSGTLLAFVDQFLAQKANKLTIDRVLRASE